MKAPIEAKVEAGTLAAAVSGVVVWLLGRYVLHGTVSAGYVAEIDVLVPAVLTAAAGWLAPHTSRAGTLTMTLDNKDGRFDRGQKTISGPPPSAAPNPNPKEPGASNVTVTPPAAS